MFLRAWESHPENANRLHLVKAAYEGTTLTVTQIAAQFGFKNTSGLHLLAKRQGWKLREKKPTSAYANGNRSRANEPFIDRVKRARRVADEAARRAQELETLAKSLSIEPKISPIGDLEIEGPNGRKIVASREAWSVWLQAAYSNIRRFTSDVKINGGA